MSNPNSYSVIHPDAQIGEDTEIGAFCVVEADVQIGKGCWIGAHVTIMNGARIGDHVQIFPGAVISAIPQDLKYQGEDTQVYIGDHTIVREYATINRGTKALGYTRVGAHCLLMAYVHVAHDCVIGNHCILANNATLAGHIEIHDYAVIGGLVAIHQFVRIGRHAMVGGGSLVRKDVPPFITVSREPLSYAGINRVGLTRRGWTPAEQKELKDIYFLLFAQGHSIPKALERIASELPNSAVKDEIIAFVRASSRGIVKGTRISDDPNT